MIILLLLFMHLGLLRLVDPHFLVFFAIFCPDDITTWSTHETAKYVQMYADSQDAFFKDYVEAHLRMAHIGCESCGKNTHLKKKRCYTK